MHLTFLYFDDCPSWEEMSSKLEAVVTAHGGAADITIERRIVDTPELAEEFGFRGSPTLLVDGVDPFADPEAPVGLSCRLYQTPDGPAGSPTLEQLRLVLAAAGDRPTTGTGYQAVFFDFGGVVLTSPFEAFARYETREGLPTGFIRTINSTNPDDNAWARMERGEVGIDGFVELFEAEAKALGHSIDGHEIITMLAGTVRPPMVEAISRIKAAGLVTACLTNNFRNNDQSGPRLDTRSSDELKAVAEVMAMFDFVVESSVVGIRKPERGFYERALELANVEANQTIFLDDLGINLKPARGMGMTTIKVVDPMVALSELQRLLGLRLLD